MDICGVIKSNLDYFYMAEIGTLPMKMLTYLCCQEKGLNILKFKLF